MALDPRYLVTFSLNELFRDKDTGEPLSNGKIYFYRDISRQDLKPIYTLDGSPPNYTYVQLPNPLSLNADGTPEYLGNNVPIYYYPRNADGSIDLYYVEVYSEDDVLQFPRQAWPNLADEAPDTPQSDVINFIPNGQFRNHLDIINPTDPGVITQAETIVAWGGWRFVRPVGSTARDVVTFERFGSYVESPTDSPRYAIRVRNESPGAGDSFKDLRVRFADVNKFQSPLGQQWTLGVEGRSNTGGNVNIQFVLIKNYGTGGDAPTEAPLGTITLTPVYDIHRLTFDFGDNTGKVIGTQNDDYLEIATRYPTNIQFDASITDYRQLEGNVATPNFPPQTDEQNNYRSIYPATPAADGSNLYLPLILTPRGVEYDTTVIGKFYPDSALNGSTVGYLLADGSQYETAAHSADGIPYSRLQTKYFDNVLGVPIHGTGRNFATSFSVGTNQFVIFNNSFGSVAVTADGATATGFTFENVYTGGDRGVDGYPRADLQNVVYLRNKATGDVITPPSENGFVYTASPSETHAVDDTGFTYTTSIRRAAFYLSCPAAAGLAGLYVRYHSGALNFYLWFTVDGAGADPALPGYTGFQVNLKSTYTAAQVAAFVAAAMTGVQLSHIQTVAGMSVAAGSYFTFNTPTSAFYVWYEKDGMGTDPAPSGRIGIKVAISDADTADQIKTKNYFAINSKYFAVPDYRGQFLRGLDASDLAARFNGNWMGSSTGLGTMQPDGIAVHLHRVPTYEQSGAVNTHHFIGYGISANLPINRRDFVTTFVGDPETRVFNKAVNFFIKY